MTVGPIVFFHPLWAVGLEAEDLIRALVGVIFANPNKYQLRTRT